MMVQGKQKKKVGVLWRTQTNIKIISQKVRKFLYLQYIFPRDKKKFDTLYQAKES